MSGRILVFSLHLRQETKHLNIQFPTLIILVVFKLATHAIAQKKGNSFLVGQIFDLFLPTGTLNGRKTHLNISYPEKWTAIMRPMYSQLYNKRLRINTAQYGLFHKV